MQAVRATTSMSPGSPTRMISEKLCPSVSPERMQSFEHPKTQVLRFVHDQNRAPRAATDRQLR
jgi:hypothetical protein